MPEYFYISTVLFTLSQSRTVKVCFNFWSMNKSSCEKRKFSINQTLISYVSCHAVCEPIDKLNEGEEPEANAQSHDTAELKTGSIPLLVSFTYISN